MFDGSVNVKPIIELRNLNTFCLAVQRAEDERTRCDWSNTGKNVARNAAVPDADNLSQCTNSRCIFRFHNFHDRCRHLAVPRTLWEDLGTASQRKGAYCSRCYASSWITSTRTPRTYHKGSLKDAVTTHIVVRRTHRVFWVQEFISDSPSWQYDFEAGKTSFELWRHGELRGTAPVSI